MTSSTFRKKPVTVEAVRYTGTNHAEIQGLTGQDHFYAVDPEDRSDDPDITAEVLDDLHSTWVGVKDGQWIIRGIRGEFYPCDEEVFAETYEATPPAPEGDPRARIEVTPAGPHLPPLNHLLTFEDPAGITWKACRTEPGTPYHDEPDEMIPPGWWVLGRHSDEEYPDVTAEVRLWVEVAVDAERTSIEQQVAVALAAVLNAPGDDDSQHQAAALQARYEATLRQALANRETVDRLRELLIDAVEGGLVECAAPDWVQGEGGERKIACGQCAGCKIRTEAQA